MSLGYLWSQVLGVNEGESQKNENKRKRIVIFFHFLCIAGEACIVGVCLGVDLNVTAGGRSCMLSLFNKQFIVPIKIHRICPELEYYFWNINGYVILHTGAGL